MRFTYHALEPHIVDEMSSWRWRFALVSFVELICDESEFGQFWCWSEKRIWLFGRPASAIVQIQTLKQPQKRRAQKEANDSAKSDRE